MRSASGRQSESVRVSSAGLFRHKRQRGGIFPVPRGRHVNCVIFVFVGRDFSCLGAAANTKSLFYLFFAFLLLEPTTQHMRITVFVLIMRFLFHCHFYSLALVTAIAHYSVRYFSRYMLLSFVAHFAVLGFTILAPPFLLLLFLSPPAARMFC